MSGGSWTLVFAEAAEADMILIENHLREAYLGFGESPEAAAFHAQTRIESILATAERLATAPLRGEAHDDLLPGLRHLALDSAIYWFLPDREAQQLKVLAIFFGGQDHQRHMLVRLLQKSRP